MNSLTAKYRSYRRLIEKNQAVTLSHHLVTFKGLEQRVNRGPTPYEPIQFLPFEPPKPYHLRAF